MKYVVVDTHLVMLLMVVARGASDITAVSGSHVARDNAAVGVLVDGGLSGVLVIHYSEAVSL